MTWPRVLKPTIAVLSTAQLWKLVQDVAISDLHFKFPPQLRGFVRVTEDS